MRCLECGHSNPESNKFCGECGARLERGAAKIDVAPPQEPLNLERRDTERERVRDSGAHVGKAQQSLLSSVIVKAEFPPATPEQEAEEERAAIDIDADAVPKRRARAAGISGPSILGLGYETAANPEGFVYDKPRRDGFIYDTDGSSPEYLLDEAPRRGVSWRAWALFAVLVIAGGLVYLQWRANRGEGPNLISVVRGYAGAAAAKISPATNGSAAATNSPSSANGNATTQAPAAANPQPTNSQPAAQPNSASAPTAAERATDNQPSAASTASSTSTLSSDSEDGDQNNPAGTAPPATAKQPNAPAQTSQPKQTAQANQASQASDEDNSETPSTPADEVAKPESDQPSRSTAKPARPKSASRAAEAVPAAAPKPKPLGDKDPLIVQAENYIQGRGRPKNCSAAVNLLRQSVGEGNPAADVKLGALYWSGTCVTQNKVTAYQWFTRAHTLEPTNRWIERSRTSMWASMNEREKQLATY